MTLVAGLVSVHHRGSIAKADLVALLCFQRSNNVRVARVTVGVIILIDVRLRERPYLAAGQRGVEKFICDVANQSTWLPDKAISPKHFSLARD